jgi:opacity protein-like surface antigen
MRRPRAFTAFAVLAGALLAAAVPAVRAQPAAMYDLVTPALLAPDGDVAPGLPLAVWGPVRLAAGGSGTGGGLSLEAGEKWFARAGIGRSLENDIVSLGAGYRFAAGDALSMQVTRQLGQERLGLAVRYDYRQTYLRLSYEQPVRAPGGVDRVRFSAGIRF